MEIMNILRGPPVGKKNANIFTYLGSTSVVKMIDARNVQLVCAQNMKDIF
jgi:hypothetical protein